MKTISIDRRYNMRLLSTIALIGTLSCLLLPGTSQAFSSASLSGGYGCVGQVTLSDSSGTLTGISEVMRLGFNGAGGVKGTIVLNLQGELCNVATTGTYTVKGSGLGAINLNWNTATGDADGDATCAVLDSAGYAQHMSFVIEGNGATLDFVASDDFLTYPSSSDGGDAEAPFTGSCKTQS